MTELNNQVRTQQMENGLHSFKPGMRVRVHLDYKMTSEIYRKRRMNFDRTGTFLRYQNGNGVVKLDESIVGKTEVELPIYFITRL